MARFVKFPGIAGSFADTEPINLIRDADTANLEQSVGNWQPLSGVTSVVISSDIDAVFGSFEGAATVPAIAERGVFTDQGTSGIPITPGVTYTFTVSITANVQIGMWTRVREHDAGGGNLPYTSSPILPVTVDEFNKVSITFTAAPTAAFLSLYVVVDGTGSTAKIYYDAASLIVGSSTSFVPSLRIVGDVGLEAKVAVTDPASGGVQWLQNTEEATNDAGYGLFIDGVGGWGAVHGDGVTDRTAIADTTLIAGQVYELKATMVAGLWTFLLDGLPDGTSQETVADAVPSGLALKFGENAEGPGEDFRGDGYIGSIRDGEDGPVVAIFDAEDIGL